ncbi:hypothetical protein EOD42_03040 [Rhodovarius crocodyli]|uniref:Uncharacterized protein n=1 Tax=Rhodovarius crocodyli TaxID=1979269 RepID=A0A437MN83_9PROT|nr:hypothetical protein [Rhodovarius crocodyli]RVT99097.1 hypothetical protein EOD42_03040 [Rhodovarius crocodyli]
MSLSATTSRMLACKGAPAELRRRAGTTGTFGTDSCRAFITSYSPDQLVGQVRQGDARAVVGAAYPSLGGPEPHDQLVQDGKLWTIMGAKERRVRGVLAGYDLWLRGTGTADDRRGNRAETEGGALGVTGGGSRIAVA